MKENSKQIKPSKGLLKKKSAQSQKAVGRNSFLRRINILTSRFKYYGQETFLKRSYLFGLFVLVVTLIISVLVTWNFLLLDGKTSQNIVIVSRPRLMLDLIDDLELWIEDRQADYDESLNVPPGVFASISEEESN